MLIQPFLSSSQGVKFGFSEDHCVTATASMLFCVGPAFIAGDSDELVTRGEKIASHGFEPNLFSDLAQPRDRVHHLLGSFFWISALSTRHHTTHVAIEMPAV
jgi:hypothetical protein